MPAELQQLIFRKALNASIADHFNALSASTQDEGGIGKKTPDNYVKIRTFHYVWLGQRRTRELRYKKSKWDAVRENTQQAALKRMGAPEAVRPIHKEVPHTGGGYHILICNPHPVHVIPNMQNTKAQLMWSCDQNGLLYQTPWKKDRLLGLLLSV